MNAVVELVTDPETDVVSVVVDNVEQAKVYPDGRIECLGMTDS